MFRPYLEESLSCFTKLSDEFCINCVFKQSLFCRSGELPKHCALFDAPLICQFKVILEENSEQFEISQLARNRIAAACECVIYLRYICEGLVKAHHNEVYWEIVKRRRKVILAKLGYSPDED